MARNVTLQILRSSTTWLETTGNLLEQGELAFATDTEDLYIGTGTENKNLGSVVSIDDLSDVSITTPNDGDLLQYNSGTWVNVTLSDNIYSESINGGTGSQWNLETTGGNLYYYDVVHNLGSKDVIVSVRDANTDLEIQPEQIDRIDVNTVRITVDGDTEDLRVVVISGNLSAGGGGGGGATKYTETISGTWSGSGPNTKTVAHSLDTTNIIVQCWRSSELVQPVSITITDANNIVITSNSNADMDVVVL